MASERDTAEVLTAEIQARPALWNIKIASYKNKHLRDRLYAEVAEILGISKETVAARRKNKKDKYRRELKKIPVLRSGDAAEYYISNWPYFYMISFLKDLLTPAVKSGNLPMLNEDSQDDEINCDLEGEKDDETDTQSDIDPILIGNSPLPVSASTTPSREGISSSASASSAISQQGKGNRRRLCDVRDEKFLDIENKKLHLLAQHLKNDANEPESEELNFFKSLILYMLKFNPIQKLKVRNNIQPDILDELLSAENRDLNIRQSTSTQNNNLLLLSSQNSSPHQSIVSSNPSTSLSAFPHQYQYQY